MLVSGLKFSKWQNMGKFQGLEKKKDRSNKVPIARAKKNIAAEGEVFLRKKGL